MALTQLGQIAMTTTDLVLLGRISDEAVRGRRVLPAMVYFVSFTLGIGLMAAVAPLAAQAFGAGNPPLVRRALCALACGLRSRFSLPIMGVPAPRANRFLQALGQAQATSHLAQDYLFGLALGRDAGALVPGDPQFSWVQSIGRRPILWITLCPRSPANALLAYLLIYGRVRGCRGSGYSAPASPTSMVNFGDVSGRPLVCDAAQAIQRLSRSMTRLWRIDLDADAPDRRNRCADLDRVPAGIWGCSPRPGY